MAAAVLITGANRGLGFEFARQYSAEGWRIFAACRNPATPTSLDAWRKAEGAGSTSLQRM